MVLLNSKLIAGTVCFCMKKPATEGLQHLQHQQELLILGHMKNVKNI